MFIYMDHGHIHHISGSGGVHPNIAGGDGGGERFPQWSVQETRDFLMIRAELDQTFMETKRNKLLWEVISKKMKGSGYYRSAEQCKVKWKNLVTRYKGCETEAHHGMRQQFPFYNDLQAIFEARIQRMLWMEAEVLGSGSKKRGMQFSSDDEEDNEESDLQKASGANTKKKKITKSNIQNNPSSSSVSNTKEILDELMKQQLQIDTEWMKTFEANEEARRLKEMEWRQKMEVLENERKMLDQRWRDREEQRMILEEVRAEKREALINTLFDKLKRV